MIQEMLIPLVVSAIAGLGAHYTTDLIKHAFKWVDNLPPHFKRAIATIVSGCVVVLGAQLQQQLPTDVQLWTPDLIEQVLVTLLGGVWASWKKAETRAENATNN